MSRFHEFLVLSPLFLFFLILTSFSSNGFLHAKKTYMEKVEPESLTFTLN